MQGVPGSGKTTVVNEKYIPQGYQIICRDDFRFSMGLGYGQNLNEKMEEEIEKIHKAVLAALMHRGCNIVIDECNVRQKYLQNLWMYIVKHMKKYNKEYTITIHTLDVDVDECIKRRGPNFPEHAIRRMDKLLREEGLPYIKRVLLENEESGIDMLNHVVYLKRMEKEHNRGTLLVAN